MVGGRRAYAEYAELEDGLMVGGRGGVGQGECEGD